MKKILFILSAIMATMFTGCQTDEWGNSTGGSGNGDINGFTINYTIDGALSSVTKATVPAIDGEEKINTMYMLFFEYTSGGIGKFLEAHDVKELTGTDDLGISGSLNIKFPSGSQLKKSEPYSILLCANIDSYLFSSISGKDDLNIMCEGLTENEVTVLIQLVLKNGSGNYESIFRDNLPMSAKASKSVDEDILEINLVRAVSRFDVTNFDKNYKLVSTSIWNAYPVGNTWDNSFNKFEYERTKRFYGVEATERNAILGNLYAYENYVTAPEVDDEVTTCLIIGLEDEDNDIYYYRVNINPTDIGQQLKRNNVYKTSINQVWGKGEKTEEEAYQSKELLLDIDINGWVLDNSGNILFDGENILAIPVKYVNLKAEGETVEYNIFTYGTGTLQISNADLPVHISANLKGSELTITAEASSYTHTGYIELQFGSLKATINITQNSRNTDFITLSVASLPFFSAAANAMSDAIKVNSSGDWKAQIYNGEYFSFRSDELKQDWTGQTTESFNIFTRSSNTDAAARYSFVLVSLIDNPEVSKVLVLAQRGVGGLTIEPAGDYYGFNAFGKPTSVSGDYYQFKVSAYEGGDGSVPMKWKAEITDGAAYFEIKDLESDKFNVYSTFNNTSAAVGGQLKVYLEDTPSVYKIIELYLAPHTVILNPNTITTKIKPAGGSTSVIEVNSSTTWSATISSSNTDAYFDDIPGKTTITGAATGEGFVITFPKLSTPNVTPSATVTVTVDGTTIQRTITAEQEALPSKNPVWQSLTNSYGSIGPSYNGYADKLYSLVRNTSYFGSNGTVYMPNGFQFLSSSRTVSSSADVYQTSYDYPTSSQGTAIYNWWKSSNNKVLCIFNDGYMSNSFSNIGLSDYRATSVAMSASLRRTFNPDQNILNNKLIKYLLEDGPFTAGGTPLTPDDIYIVGRDAANNFVSSYPSTFVPILVHPTNPGLVILGIDPVNRLVVCGDVDIFSSGAGTSVNWVGTRGENNQKFMNNFIAWIANAVMYGEDFTNQFK